MDGQPQCSLISQDSLCECAGSLIKLLPPVPHHPHLLRRVALARPIKSAGWREKQNSSATKSADEAVKQRKRDLPSGIPFISDSAHSSSDGLKPRYGAQVYTVPADTVAGTCVHEYG